jgi:hypothetical protein
MVGNAGINVVRALGDKAFGEAVSADPSLKRTLTPGKQSGTRVMGVAKMRSSQTSF